MYFRLKWLVYWTSNRMCVSDWCSKLRPNTRFSFININWIKISRNHLTLQIANIYILTMFIRKCLCHLHCKVQFKRCFSRQSYETNKNIYVAWRWQRPSALLIWRYEMSSSIWDDKLSNSRVDFLKFSFYIVDLTI